MLIVQTPSEILVHFLGPGSLIQPNIGWPIRIEEYIGWPIRIEELHNCMKELEVKGKAYNSNSFCCKFS